MILLSEESSRKAAEEAKKATLKMKNQKAHLDSLLRKKQALQIEIERLKKTIKLQTKRTQTSILKEMKIEDLSLPLSNEEALDLQEKDPELFQIFKELDQAEADLKSLLEQFREEQE